MLATWQNSGSKLDVDLAREIALDIQQNPEPYQGLDAAVEADILTLIDKAHRELG
jgi:hypothetical protein